MHTHTHKRGHGESVFACASTLVWRGEYRAQTGIWRLLGFVSARTIKGRSITYTHTHTHTRTRTQKTFSCRPCGRPRWAPRTSRTSSWCAKCAPSWLSSISQAAAIVSTVHDRAALASLVQMLEYPARDCWPGQPLLRCAALGVRLFSTQHVHARDNITTSVFSYLLRVYPNGCISVGYFLFLQEQIKDHHQQLSARRLLVPRHWPCPRLARGCHRCWL